MGGCDQFVRVGAPFALASPGRKVLAFEEGRAFGSYNAFSVFEIADPNGRSVSFHENRFLSENGPGTLGTRCPVSICDCGKR